MAATTFGRLAEGWGDHFWLVPRSLAARERSRPESVLLGAHQGAIAASQASDLIRIRVVSVPVRGSAIQGEGRSRAARRVLNPARALIVIVPTVVAELSPETVVAVADARSVLCCASSLRPYAEMWTRTKMVCPAWMWKWLLPSGRQPRAQRASSA